MKIDLSVNFIGLDRKVINAVMEYMVAEKKDGVYKPLQDEHGNFVIGSIPASPLTLRRVCEEVLLIDEKDEKIAPEEKIKRSKLGMRILLSEVDLIELSDTERILLRDAITKKKPTLIAGQAHEFLDIK